MIQAIETVYNGYRFRSRLEARWAVFFDALGIAYQYEYEGFELDSGEWYLPDFWLPALQFYIEVKPGVTYHDAIPMCKSMANGDKPIALCIDLPNARLVHTFCYDTTNSSGGVWEGYDGFWVISKRGFAGLCPTQAQRNRAWYADPGMRKSIFGFVHWDDIETHVLSVLDVYNAADAAKQARFEHGQIGAPRDWN